MKILAIRGAGLASLAEPFAIDLQAGALGRAGVFAIVGPTGAGKSTLLDALFLALFGETPRLASQPRTAVARARAGDDDAFAARDPRSLARSDADHAYAEVDFRGVDGARYRARWDLRRATPPRRSVASPGAHELSPWRRAEHALSRLDPAHPMGQRVGGTKTEVLGHIEARLGLDFDEFRRAVVLAQGEIAAFLHAPDRDRAELLERMTGTEIYGELSKEIHLETVRQRARSEQLESQLGAIQALDPQARAHLTEALAAARIDALEAERQRAEDERTHATYRAAIALAEEVEHAERDVERLRVELERAASQRGEIEAHARVMGLVPLLTAFDRACAEERDGGDRERDAAAQGALLRERARATQALETSAREALETACTQHDASAAALRRAHDQREAARPLEAEAASQEARHAEAEAAHQAAAESAARAQRELDRAREAITRWEARLSDAPGIERVLARAGAGEPGFEAEDLAARAAHLGARKAHAEARAATSAQEQQRAREEDARTQRNLEAAEENARAVATRAQRAAARLDALLKEAERELEGATPPRELPRVHDDRRGARSPFLGRLVARGEVAGRLRAPSHEGRTVVEAGGDRSILAGSILAGSIVARSTLANLGEEIRPLLARATRCRARVLEARAQAERDLARARERAEGARRARVEEARARTELLRFAEELTEARAQLRDADALLARAEAHADAIARAAYAHALRAHLVAGQPCEVCGAVEHRRAQASTPTSAQNEEAEEAQEARAAREEARLRRDALGARTLALESAYVLLSRAREANPLEAPPRDREALHVIALTPPPTADAMEARLLLLDGRRSEIETRHADLLEAMGRLTQTEQHAASARAGRERAQRHLGEAARGAELAELDLRELSESEASSGLTLLLDAQRSARTPEGDLLSFLRRVVAERVEAQRAVARLEILEAHEAQARAVLAAAERDRSRAHADRARAADAARAFAQAASAFDLAAREEGERRRALDAARLAHTDAERARQEAAQHAEVACAAEAHAQALHVAARERRETLGAELLAALRGAGLLHPSPTRQPAARGREDARDLQAGLALARGWAARSADEIASMRRAWEALDAARRDAEAVLGERQRRRTAHAEEHGLGARSEWADLAQLRARFDRQGARVEAQRGVEAARRAELARATEALRRDDASRAELAARRAEHDAQRRERETWEQLASSLGSADGRKLRVYAQRLTLRTLIREASHHLSTLAPRYAIEAVPGGDLAIQVSDRALSGEVRAIGALSGGETFLVSLALALALRGMSSDRVRIETLFIDEGFGALDAASLEVVLSALDALEASGRQVGIVSHVPEVKERFAARVEVLPDPSPRGGGKSRVRIAV